MKKILKTIYILIIAVISIAVIYTAGYRTVFYILNNRSVSSGDQVDFSGYGSGISWINKNNKKTLFFIPSSEEMASEKLYGSWLNGIYEELSVNVIIPPFDIEGKTPYLLGENESVSRRIDMITYLYKLYSEQMDEKHSITIVTTGDGSLAALELTKRFSTMDKLILISPVHTSLARRGGTLFHKLEGLPVVHYMIPWLIDSYGKSRVGSYDILNDNLNAQFSNQFHLFYPEFMNLAYSRILKKKTAIVMNDLSEVQSNRFFIIYGDDDLSYGLEGFERMGDQLDKSGSEVSIMRIPQSGRMILFDNGRDQIIDLVSILLQ